MYFCKYMIVTRDIEGHRLCECPFKKKAEVENTLLEKNIFRPLCPEDVKRDADGSSICYEI